MTTQELISKFKEGTLDLSIPEEKHAYITFKRRQKKRLPLDRPAGAIPKKKGVFGRLFPFLSK